MQEREAGLSNEIEMAQMKKIIGFVLVDNPDFFELTNEFFWYGNTDLKSSDIKVNPLLIDKLVKISNMSDHEFEIFMDGLSVELYGKVFPDVDKSHKSRFLELLKRIRTRFKDGSPIAKTDTESEDGDNVYDIFSGKIKED